MNRNPQSASREDVAALAAMLAAALEAIRHTNIDPSEQRRRLSVIMEEAGALSMRLTVDSKEARK